MIGPTIREHLVCAFSMRRATTGPRCGFGPTSTLGSANQARHPSIRSRQASLRSTAGQLGVRRRAGDPRSRSSPCRAPILHRGPAARCRRPSRRRRRRGRGPGRSAGPAPERVAVAVADVVGQNPLALRRAPSVCAGRRPAARAGTPRRCPRWCRAGSPRSCRRGSRALAGSPRGRLAGVERDRGRARSALDRPAGGAGGERGDVAVLRGESERQQTGGDPLPLVVGAPRPRASSSSHPGRAWPSTSTSSCSSATTVALPRRSRRWRGAPAR